jgi:hypothetical protein
MRWMSEEKGLEFFRKIKAGLQVQAPAAAIPDTAVFQNEKNIRRLARRKV